MREIKFRAWEVLEDDEGNENWDMEYREVQVSENGKHLSYGFEIDSSVLMQYTGLKDKNGVEIYEGDIVKKPADLFIGSEIVAHEGEFHIDAVVEWVDGSFRLNKIGDDSKNYYGVMNYSQNTYAHKLEVIGNIYENPELLEQDK